MIDKGKFNMLEKSCELNLVKETAHFIVYYTEVDEIAIHKIADVLENNYTRIINIFNEQLSEKLCIEIHSNLKQLHGALGLSDAPNWIRGGLGVDRIVIASPLNPPPGSNFDNVVNTAVHEFIHIIINKINGNTPRWLNEGIACFEAKDNDEGWIRQTVKEGLSNNTVPTFNDLDTGEDFETFFQYDGYQYSYTIVEAIISLFGYEKLNQLIQSPKNFIEIFEMTQIEVQNKWMNYIESNYLFA